MKLSMMRFAVLMAAAEGAAGGGAGATTTDATNAQAQREAHAAEAAAQAPDPVAASIATAREWIASGEVTEGRAAEWLHANCPESFKDEKDALRAISQ